MKNKWIISLILAFLISVMVIIYAFAGYSLDYGELNPMPPENKANWTAWNQTWLFVTGQPPREILTEDNTNCELGEDLGYANFDGNPRDDAMVDSGGEFHNACSFTWFTV
jgi:hypothetical protein